MIKPFIVVLFGQVELHSGKFKIRLLVRTGKLSSNLKLYTAVTIKSVPTLLLRMDFKSSFILAIFLAIVTKWVMNAIGKFVPKQSQEHKNLLKILSGNGTFRRMMRDNWCVYLDLLVLVLCR